MGMTIGIAGYVVLAGLHSVLGEKMIISAIQGVAVERSKLPTAFIGRLLRMVWHLTSLGWLFPAAMLWLDGGRSVTAGAAVLALASGLMILVISRGAHFAWALFFVVAVALGLELGVAPWLPKLCAVLAALALATVAALHLGWASGLRWGLTAALPQQKGGSRVFTPPRWAVVAVAAALGVAAVLAASLGGWVTLPVPTQWLRVAGWLAAAVFGARVVGDSRFTGLFKRERSTQFARWDDRLHTPLCFALSACLVVALRS